MPIAKNIIIAKPYTYYLRPAYGRKELLLEFFITAADAEFDTDLLNALSDIKPVIISAADLWMNDEVELQIHSDKGAFLLSKDIWGFVFITANSNQTCIKFIDEILCKNNLFKKEEVDFEKYKIAKD